MSTPRRRTLLTTGLAAGMAVAIGACGAGGGEPATTEAGLTRLVVDYGPTANTAQLTLGIQRGIFERHGIEIEQLPGTGASANSVALLLNGQVQLAVSEITAVPAAVANGFPVQIVTSMMADYSGPTGDVFSLVVPADSDIRSFADLSGRSVAVNGLESIFDLTVFEAVRQAGGDPAAVEVIAIPFEDQVAALRQGRVDAITTVQPFAGQLLADGFRSVGNPAAAALGPRSVAGVLMASQQFVEQNPDALRRFLQAWEEATRYANEHPDEIRQTIQESTGAPGEAIARLPLPWYVSGVDRRSAELVAALMVEHGRIESAPALDAFTWSQSPDATDLTTPPPGVQVSD